MEEYSEVIVPQTPDGHDVRSGIRGGDHVTPYRYYRDRLTINQAYRKDGSKVFRFASDYVYQLGGNALSPSEQLYVTNSMNHVSNKALEKMDEALSYSRSYFEDWYERQQAVDLAINAIEGIADFLLNWRKPRYWKKMAGNVKPRSVPEAWLAYNFGIAPLMGTFDDCMNKLGSKFPEYHAVGRSSAVINFKYENPWVQQYCAMRYSRAIGCTVTGYNPNKGLLQISGLNQPLSSAMSVIPWGWAVEYFVNVSQVLSNFEVRHPGVEISRKWNTTIKWTKYHGYSIEGYTKYPRYGEMYNKVRNPGGYGYLPTFSFPLLLGGNQLANLSSAVALSMKKTK